MFSLVAWEIGLNEQYHVEDLSKNRSMLYLDTMT